MIAAIVIYVEGGGDPKDKDKRQALRLGFEAFLGDLRRAARDRNMDLRVVPHGGRDETYRAFVEALEYDRDDLNVLLLDSEASVAGPCWSHIATYRDKNWPLTADDDSVCHLMVQAMEAWLVADPEALARFYIRGFDATKLPSTDTIESKSPRELSIALKRATRKTGRPERYHKLRHAPEILRLLNAEKVRAACPHCDRLFQFLSDQINATA
jgi:hypothetical protein